MGFSGVNNFPTHTIVDGTFARSSKKRGMGVEKEYDMIAVARKMDMFSIVYVHSTDEATAMAEAGQTRLSPMSAPRSVARSV